MSVGDNISQDQMSGGQLFLGQNVRQTIYRGDKISCDTGTVSNRKSVRVKISTEAPPLELEPWNELVKMTYSLNDILDDVINTSPTDDVI